MSEPVEDLATWLTVVWGEEERLATNRWTTNPLAPPVDVHFSSWDDAGMVTVGAPGSSLTHTMTIEEYQRAYLVPAPNKQELARIAADRKILALHSYHMVPSLDSRLQPIPGSRRPHCDTCASQDENGEWWPCATVRLLAESHADKPGFRSEWLVERQGVER